MKIDSKLSVERIRRTQQVDDSEDDPRARVGGGPGRDRVALSGEIAALTEIVERAPIEETDLDELKRAIASGEYAPDLESLTDRLLSNPAIKGALSDE